MNSVSRSNPRDTYQVLAHDQAALDYAADRGNGQYPATWSLDGSHTHYVTTNTADGATVILGNKSIADAQRAADGESLAALACGYGPSTPAPVEPTVVDADALAHVTMIAVEKHPRMDAMIAKAYVALSSGQVRQIQTTRCTVIQLGTGGTYELSQHGKVVVCSCKAYGVNALRGQVICKHIWAGFLAARANRIMAQRKERAGVLLILLVIRSQAL